MSTSELRAAAPLLVLGSAALLISILVSGILAFGHRVSTFYTPGIMAYQDLLRSMDHLEETLRREHGRLAPGNPAFRHYMDALDQTEAVLHGTSSQANNPSENKKLLQMVQTLGKRIERGDTIIIPEQLSGLREQTEQHLLRHEAELGRAMTYIGALSVSTGILCLFLIGLGAWGSIRERHLARDRQHKAESTSALLALVRSLDARDHYTRGHSDRVSQYAERIGKQLCLTPKQLSTLALAARLHDIGKIGVPDAVLFKHGKLNANEFEKMKRHPTIGADMLTVFPRLDEVGKIILHHHERWDGKGYPEGLRENAIPLLSQIIAIADAYDAMTSSRPYRKALSAEQAKAEIKRCAGMQWSTTMTTVFFDILATPSAPVPDATTQTARNDTPLRAV